jgi:hypothetical protein
MDIQRPRPVVDEKQHAEGISGRERESQKPAAILPGKRVDLWKERGIGRVDGGLFFEGDTQQRIPAPRQAVRQAIGLRSQALEQCAGRSCGIIKRKPRQLNSGNQSSACL